MDQEGDKTGQISLLDLRGQYAINRSELAFVQLYLCRGTNVPVDGNLTINVWCDYSGPSYFIGLLYLCSVDGNLTNNVWCGYSGPSYGLL